MKIKVLHIFGKMDKGGAETLIMNVYRNIDRQKIQFDFLTYTNEVGDYDEEIVKLGGKIINYPLVQNNKLIYNYTKYLHSLIRTNKYHVIHSHVHWFSGLNMVVSKFGGAKIRISHSHTAGNMHELNYKRIVYQQLMRLLIIKFGTDNFACGVEAGKALFGQKPDFVIIKNAIVSSKFDNIDNHKIDAKKKLGLPLDGKIIGHVGRFENVKNHQFLVDIFESIRNKNQDIYLAFVGKGSLEETIKKYVKDKGLENETFFLGQRDDIPEIMSTFDTFVLPSFYEGVPTVLIEAQYMGLPCIVSESVSKECCMDDTYLKFISLNEDVQFWKNQILSMINKKNIYSKEAILKKGYEITSVVECLFSVYVRES